MLNKINKNQGIPALFALILSGATFFFSDQKWWVLVIIMITILLMVSIHLYEKRKPKNFKDTQKASRILFVDDKECQIVTNLRRNNFDVRKIDDILSPATDIDVQWANIIFVDYKDVGKKLCGKKEGLGLISELKRVYGDKKRYIIYSSVQDFDGLVEFPYIRKNASYDEFISLITAEITKL
ncbi:MAG: hypothetical protein AAB497_00985 [Patescibacteria group bacterium]